MAKKITPYYASSIFLSHAVYHMYEMIGLNSHIAGFVAKKITPYYASSVFLFQAVLPHGLNDWLRCNSWQNDYTTLRVIFCHIIDIDTLGYYGWKSINISRPPVPLFEYSFFQHHPGQTSTQFAFYQPF